MADDDPRLGQLGNVLSRDLDKLAKNGRVRCVDVSSGRMTARSGSWSSDPLEASQNCVAMAFGMTA
jgi:hypothetical protein